MNWIAAEDTRVSRVLLNHIGSSAAMVSLHEHNETQVCGGLIERLLAGQSGALISDAGTPAISDPGATLVAAAHDAGIRVVPIPGPSAPVVLLSVAGFAPGPHMFVGFLPPRPRARQQRLAALRSMLDPIGAHLLLFEAPHRIIECLRDLLAEFGPHRTIVLARELTKQFEEVFRCPLAHAEVWLGENPNRLRGEYVIGIAAPAGGHGDSDTASDTAAAADDNTASFSASLPDLLLQLMQDIPLSQAVRIAQRLSGAPHRKVYQLALALNRSTS